MDVNDFRIAFTLFSMVIFLGIASWAFSKRNKQSLNELGGLPLMDDQAAGEISSQGGRNE